MAGELDSRLEVVLATIHLAARDTHLFTFERPTGATLPAAEAGAHVALRLPNGIERQYSLLHPDAAPHRYEIGVKRDPASRGGSRYLHECARVGMRFFMHPPRNNFPLEQSAERTVLIAGGIGITPIYSMIQRLRTLGMRWHLHYACRSRQDTAFLDELESDRNVTCHFDDAEGGRHLPVAAIVADAPAHAHLYCCGPASMLAAFEGAVHASGRLPSHAHLEDFAPKLGSALEGGFVVELARAGREVAIPPGKSILHALRELGIAVPSSCEEGVCGSCETRVISGTPDHRDAILTEQERRQGATMMICCSGSKSARLVLDL